MFKVNQLAKDLGMKNKEILTKMENSGVSVKSYMATLEPDEFNVFFDELTRENQIKDLDGYLSGKTQIRRKKAEEKKTECTEQCCGDCATKAEECCAEGCCKEECDKQGECCKEECADCTECTECPDCEEACSE